MLTNTRQPPCVYLWVMLWIVLGLAACAAPPPTPLPSVAEVVEQSAQAMADLRTVHFVIERDGAPAFVDAARTFIFRRAEGDFVAPDQTQATVRVVGPALAAEVQVIALADDYWETNPVTGAWAKYGGWGYNPARLFNPDTGLPALLRQTTTTAQLLGVVPLEDWPGERFFHLTATAPGEPLLALTANLVGHGTLTLEWWAEVNTQRVWRLLITEPETDPHTPTTWLVEFNNFDSSVIITPPTP